MHPFLRILSVAVADDHTINSFTLTVLSILGVLVVASIVFQRFLSIRVRRFTQRIQESTVILRQALEVSGNNVARIDAIDHYVYPVHGYVLPEEGLTYQETLEHVHPDDRQRFHDFIMSLFEGTTKSGELTYGWNFNYSGGKPRWGVIRNNAIAEYTPGLQKPLNVICTFVNDSDTVKRQEEERELTEKYRLIFERSIVGLSFYDADGYLIDVNENMRGIYQLEGKDQEEFEGSCLFDLPPFRGNVDRQHPEEFWVCTQSVLGGREKYLEVRMHPVLDSQGNVIYFSLAARDVTSERQLYLQVRENEDRIQEANLKIQSYETELNYMMESIEMRAWRSDFDKGTVSFYKGLNTPELVVTLAEMASFFIDDHEAVAHHFTYPEEYYSKPMSYMGRMRPIFHDTDEIQWNAINSVPVYDDNGRLTGAFGLVRNITHLMKKQEQLRQETERANDSGHQKSVFLANMTHEIRTPLNAIVGFSDLLTAIEQPEERRELIRIIHNNCDMLLRLINDILAMSQMDSEAGNIQPTDVDFAKEFGDVCQSLAQRVQDTPVQFIVDNPLDTLPVKLDMERIEQVITNFVTNAVKYTQQGHIRVGYRLENRAGQRCIYVYCEDTGTGIPADKCEKVFDRFFKVNEFIQGTGLGLSICKTIVERCGGQIGVESVEGKGSTFWFWLPV